MSVRNAVRNAVRPAVRGVDERYDSLLPPFPSDLTFDFNKRDGTTLIDRISGEEAEIKGGYVADFDGVDSTELNAGQDSDFNIGTDDFWMAGTFMTTDNSPIQGIQGCNQAASNVDRYGVFISSADFSAIFGTSTGTDIVTSLSISNNTLYNYIATFDRDGNVTLYVGASNGSLDISTYSTHNLLQDNDYRLGNYGTVSNTSKYTLDGYLGVQIFGKGELPTSADIEKARYGDFSTVIPKATRVWYLNNNEESTEKRTLSNNNVDFSLINDVKLQSVEDALDNGYYISDTGDKVINPQFALPAGWTAVAGGKVHNGIDSFGNLNPDGKTDAKYAILDRSNTTTQTAESRDSIYFDSDEPYKYFLGTFEHDFGAGNVDAFGELDYRFSDVFFETANTNKVFQKVKTKYSNYQNEISRLLIYATKKTGSELNKVLSYIKYDL